MTGSEELPEAEHGVHGTLAALQQKLAFLPGYSFPSAGEGDGGGQFGTSVSGVVGGLVTLVLCALIGITLRHHAAMH